MESTVDRADRLGRRRARLFFIVAILLITQQASFSNLLQHGDGPLRAADWVWLAGWTVMVLAALFALLTGGSYLQSAEVRALMNDESARHNRAKALSAGFMVAILTGVVAFIASFFETPEPRVAIHVMVSTGLAGALLRFAALERRAYRDV